MIPEEEKPELTVIVISYNTRELTLKCLETLFANTHSSNMRVVLWDNASHDGSADAVAAAFPQVELVRSNDNIGFARANNEVAATAQTDWLLLLNPDTETHANAVDNLLQFAKDNPQAGITGGRTVFPDGSLNKASCWRRMTPWSIFCLATGLSFLFPKSNIFNPEAMGGWKRDSVRHVDIVVGCFFMIRRELWNELGGFDRKYFMYGEEADLCLRARARGYRPMITPDAQIMHLVGAATAKKSEKVAKVAQAKVTIIRDHWKPSLVPVGITGMWLWAAGRYLGASFAGSFLGKAELAEKWSDIWSKRKIWLSGYN